MTISNVCAALAGLGALATLVVGTPAWVLAAAVALLALAVIIYPK